jgi:hypothetical protein
MKGKGLFWFLRINIKFGLIFGIILGVIGLFLYLALPLKISSFESLPDNFVYNSYQGQPFSIYYSKNRHMAKVVINYYDSTNIDYRKAIGVGKDIGILTINSTVKVLDTINSDIVKFVRLYQTGSKTNTLVGYTHLINIHSIPVKDSLAISKIKLE